MNKLKFIFGKFTFQTVILFLISAILVLCFLLTSMYRELTDLESILFQVFTLGTGIAASYILGKQSAQSAAQDVIKPHARSSFRRILSLYEGLSRLALSIVEIRNNSKNPPTHLDVLEAIVVEQISTADDAIEDWRDLVPEEVEEIEKRLKKYQF